MVVTYVGVVLTIVAAVAIIAIGIGYLLAPEAVAESFGLEIHPGEHPSAWLNVKGIRDMVSGLAGLVLLLVAPLSIVGCYLAVAALIPLGDAVIVIRHGGSKRFAYGVHAATAALLIVIAVLLLLG